ncbi:MAG: hypothetical protein NTZ13_04635 [Candidatus Parcubacteria bacterium]|nr:hypothetical protein [Candidatus Parcubacteria bacterium]
MSTLLRQWFWRSGAYVVCTKKESLDILFLMETPVFEKGAEGNSAEAFFARVLQELDKEEEKLEQMDGDKEVSKEEYEKIKAQAKLVAFLREVKDAAVLCAEAEENDNAELFDVMKKYLKV